MRWLLAIAWVMLICSSEGQANSAWRATELTADGASYFRNDTWRMTNSAVNGRAARRNPNLLAKGDSPFEPSFLLLKTPGLRQMPNGLPDGGKAILGEVQLPTGTWYEKPTSRYPHGALGDDIEAGQLNVQIGQLEHGRFVHELSNNQVFEDRIPRVVDLDGFGKASVVTILTEVTKGASVALFGPDKPGLKGSKFELLAQTPYIGTPNRWLNIAGIDDFDGSGSSSIALVETPHIGGTLQFWRWSKGTLTKIAEAPGFSNHKFGSREQRLSAVEDFDNDGVSDLALPSADRRTLKLIRLSDRKNPQVEEIASIPLPSPIDKAIGVSRSGDDVILTVGLEDGSVYAIHQ